MFIDRTERQTIKKERFMKIKDKIVVITGGTSGIGYELVKQLSQMNRVIVIARDQNKLHKIQEEFTNVDTYKAELSNLTEVEDVADKIVKKYPSVDVLINNAAIQHTPILPSKNFVYENIHKEVTINFTSVCCLTYLLLGSLLNADKAIILNVNSGLALAPKTSSAIYCATKAALNNFTLSLRYQLEDSQIAVQQVFLELVDTGMTSGRGQNKLSSKNAAEKILSGMEKGILDHDIGKVKLLRLMLRIAPKVVRRIMKQN